MNWQKLGAFGSMVLAGVMLAVVLLAGRDQQLPAARAGTGGDDRAVPESAQTRESYVLSSFKVVYPHEAAGLTDPDPGWAGVVFTAEWTGNEFPGTAKCTVSLRDEAGNVVGSRAFEPLYVPKSSETAPLDVEVSGVPASAEGTCEPDSGVYAEGPGYSFELVDVTPSDVGTKFTFLANWEAPIDPTVRDCVFAATSETGERFEANIQYMAPDGTEFVQEVPFPNASSPAMTCNEL
jgi:hypothetical protein